jgi:beta-carotene hydroxylase
VQGSLNVIVGYACANSFPFAPFAAFKHCHLQHHSHTNDKEKDPDMWTALGPWFLLPLRWLTVDLSYYARYLPLLSTRPFSEACGAVAQLAWHAMWMWHLTVAGYGHVVLYAWLIPGRLALAWLAFTFDYLPHRPHSHTRAENPIAATAVTSLFGTAVWPLTWPLLQQNMHNIHHHWPFIPFYMYDTVWQRHKEDLLGMGTAIIPVLSTNK